MEYLEPVFCVFAHIFDIRWFWRPLNVIKRFQTILKGFKPFKSESQVLMTSLLPMQFGSSVQQDFRQLTARHQRLRRLLCLLDHISLAIASEWSGSATRNNATGKSARNSLVAEKFYFHCYESQYRITFCPKNSISQK